jgi:dTDP-4-dehydrorhamnose reductase
MRPLRVLVLGAGGLVGSALVARAAARGVLVDADPAQPSTTAARLDIRDTAGVVERARRCAASVVVVAAARAHVEACEADPAGTRAINVDAPVSIAKAAPSLRLVCISSEYVFAGGDERPYVEDDPRNPINEYGRQKTALEEQLLERGSHLMVRTSGVYGPEDRRKNFVLSTWDRLRRGERVAVANDQVVTPTFAPDLADSILDAIAAAAGGVLHLAGPEVFARDEFVRRCARAPHLPGSVEARLAQLDPMTTAQLGLRAPRPHRAALSSARARERGWAPRVTVDEGLARLAAWDSARTTERTTV